MVMMSNVSILVRIDREECRARLQGELLREGIHDSFDKYSQLFTDHFLAVARFRPTPGNPPTAIVAEFRRFVADVTGTDLAELPIGQLLRGLGVCAESWPDASSDTPVIVEVSDTDTRIPWEMLFADVRDAKRPSRILVYRRVGPSNKTWHYPPNGGCVALGHFDHNGFEELQHLSALAQWAAGRRPQVEYVDGDYHDSMQSPPSATYVCSFADHTDRLNATIDRKTLKCPVCADAQMAGNLAVLAPLTQDGDLHFAPGLTLSDPEIFERCFKAPVTSFGVFPTDDEGRTWKSAGPAWAVACVRMGGLVGASSYMSLPWEKAAWLVRSLALGILESYQDPTCRLLTTAVQRVRQRIERSYPDTMGMLVLAMTDALVVDWQDRCAAESSLQLQNGSNLSLRVENSHGGVVNVTKNDKPMNFDHSQVGQAFGHAEVQKMTVEQHWQSEVSPVQLDQLSEQLEALRAELQTQAGDAERSAAVGQVAQAQISAQKKDPNGVSRHLAAVGNFSESISEWVLDTATKIGAGLVVAWLKEQLGW